MEAVGNSSECDSRKGMVHYKYQLGDAVTAEQHINTFLRVQWTSIALRIGYDTFRFLRNHVSFYL